VVSLIHYIIFNRIFSEELGQYLSRSFVVAKTETIPDSAPVERSLVPVTPSPQLEPLKTSRFSGVGNVKIVSTVAVPSGDTSSSSTRLLFSALQSSRDNSSKTASQGKRTRMDTNVASNQSQKRVKQPEQQSVRNVVDLSSNGNKNTNRGPIQQPPQQQNIVLRPSSSSSQQYQQNKPHYQHHQQLQPVDNIATPLLETVKYFEEMNKVAKLSGFQNAQEMIASQKEMMALMTAATTPTAVGLDASSG